MLSVVQMRVLDQPVATPLIDADGQGSSISLKEDSSGWLALCVPSWPLEFEPAPKSLPSVLNRIVCLNPEQIFYGFIPGSIIISLEGHT